MQYHKRTIDDNIMEKCMWYLLIIIIGSLNKIELRHYVEMLVIMHINTPPALHFAIGRVKRDHLPCSKFHAYICMLVPAH